MKKLLSILAISISTSSFCADIAKNEAYKSINYRDVVPQNTLINGVPIFKGGNNVQMLFEDSKLRYSTGGANPIPILNVRFKHEIDEGLFAVQAISQAIESGYSYWNGSPCSPNDTRIFIKNKGGGRKDECLTIEPVNYNVGESSELFLSIKLTNTSSYYMQIMEVAIRANAIGFRNTGVGDWTKDAIEISPAKKEFMGRLQIWSEKLQDASVKAIKDKDITAFDNVPPLQSLAPVPSILPPNNYSVTFIGAARDILYNDSKKDFKAIAYSPRDGKQTKWGSAWGKQTKSDAINVALANCERDKEPSLPPCVVLGEEKNSNYIQANLVAHQPIQPSSLTVRNASISNVDSQVRSDFNKVTSNPIDQQKKTSSNEIWISFNPSVTVQERQFCRIVENFRTERMLAEQSRNQIKVNETYKSFTQSLNALLPDGKFQGWVMRTVWVSQATDGSAEVLLELPCNIYVGSNACDDNPKNFYGTAPEGSRIYSELAKMTVGDFTLTNGQFVYTDNKAFDKNRSVASFRMMKTAAHCRAKEMPIDGDFFGMKLDVISTLK